MLPVRCPENVVPKAIGHAKINVFEFVMDLMMGIQFSNPRAAKTEVVMDMMKRTIDQLAGHHTRPERHEVADL